MIEKLLKLQENSYVPVSGYRTSEGVNVENPSFRDGMCAEQTAIASACANGYGKNSFAALYIMTDGESVSTPCFLCRQLISELFEDSSLIICYNKKGDVKMYKVSDLCPYPFGESNLV